MNETYGKGSPRDVFLYLALLITLYVSAYTFVRLMFVYIDHLVSDPLYRTAGYDADGVRWAIAVLLFVFPAFFIISRVIGLGLVKNIGFQELKARKWVLSLTLFVSAGVALGDLVYLTYNMLSGDLGSKYVLKSITVLFVAGLTFGYYLWDLKSPFTRIERAKAVPAFVASVVLGSTIGGFFMVGTPGQQRAKRFDEDRVYALRNISRSVEIYFSEKESLPANLVELEKFSGSSLQRDPETNAPYEYKVLNPTYPASFELCANFKTKPEEHSRFSSDSEWKYAPGRTCFTRKAEAIRK